MTQPGIHWPYCIDGRCPGCMPDVTPTDRDARQQLDLSIFEKPSPERTTT